MTPFDKALTRIAPGWAYKRAVARHNLGVLNSVYNPPGFGGPGVGTRRNPDVQIVRGSEDYINGMGYDQLIANCMQLYRVDPMTRSIVDVVATYMGESRPTAETDDEKFNDEATDYFNNYFWNTADARRRPGVDFGMMQTLWTKYSMVGGDMLFAITDDGLYPYEGLQVRTPNQLRTESNIKNGVRVQTSFPHRITHYYVVDLQSSPMFTHGDDEFTRIRQSSAIFAPGKYWRTAMLRSLPELHACVEPLMAYVKTNKNVQSKIQFESMLWSIERSGSLGNIPGSGFNARGGTGQNVQYSEADWGMRFKVEGEPDRDFKLSGMENPGSQHVPYMEHAGRWIAAGVGLPYEVVAHLYTNGSYTANRAARTDFVKWLMDRHAWRGKILNRRVWNWKIASAIKAGEIRPAPLDANGRSTWDRATWTLPHIPHIDEGKEIVADVKRWGSCQDSISDWARETNRTRTQMLNAHDRDVREMKERADQLGVTLNEYANQLFNKPAAGTSQGGENA